MSSSLPISNSSNDNQAQRSVNESDEHSGKTRTQTVMESAAEPDSFKDTASRPIRSSTLPARFKDFVMSYQQNFHQTSMIEDLLMLCF